MDRAVGKKVGMALHGLLPIGGRYAARMDGMKKHLGSCEGKMN